MIKLQTFFYLIYRATSSSSYFLSNRVTPLGLIILFLMPASMVVFITYYKPPTLYLFCLFCGILSFSLFSVFLRSAKLKIVRKLPSFASVGQEITYTIQCKNLSNKKIISSLLHDHTLDPRPTKNEFVHSREPQEHLRNSFDRLLAYYRWLWLCKHKSKFQSAPILLNPINGLQEVDVHATCTPLRRGRLEFSSTKLYLPDPLYLFQKCKRVISPSDSILILPKRYKLPAFIMEGTARDHSGGLAQSNMSGLSDDFRGLRPYRPGDTLKQMDWAAWARTGKPIVREYENFFFPRYGLVLDTNGEFEHPEHFEEAVSLAASFALVVDTKECLLDFIFLNKGTQTLTIGKGVARSEELLEQLATLEIETQPDWLSLTQQVVKHSREFSICFVIFTRLTDERRQLVKEWKIAGLNTIMFVLVHDDESKHQALAIGAHPLHINSVQSDLFNIL